VRTKKNLAKAAVRKDGNKTVVTADIHHPGDGDMSDEEDDEPDLPSSESSDGETLWCLSEDARKGTGAIFGAQHGARQSSVQQDEEEIEEEDWVRSESDAPTDHMALDPEVGFKHKHHTIRAAKDLVPAVLPKVGAQRGDGLKKSLRSGSRIS